MKMEKRVIEHLTQKQINPPNNTIKEYAAYGLALGLSTGMALGGEGLEKIFNSIPDEIRAQVSQQITDLLHLMFQHEQNIDGGTFEKLVFRTYLSAPLALGGTILGAIAGTFHELYNLILQSLPDFEK